MARPPQCLVVALFIVVMGALAQPLSAWAEPPSDLDLVATDANKREVGIGLMYNGDNVFFFGTVPDPTADVVVKLTAGSEESLVVNHKGRVGPFWMNVKQYKISGIPWVYKIHSTRPLNEIVGPDLAHELGIGYEVLKDGMELEYLRGEPEDDDRDVAFDGILKLKQDANLYNVDEKRIEISGGKLFKHYFRFPPAAKEGEYLAESFVFKDGQLVGRGVDRLMLQKTGLEAALSSMAKNQPVLYGLLAVIVALGVGLLVGYLFKKGGGH